MATQMSQNLFAAKDELAHIEAVDASKHQHDSEHGKEFSPAEQRNIIRRLDRRLVVTSGIMFCFSLMDRSNLGAASIAGMTKDLKLVQYRYSIIALVFFIPYIMVQPISSLMCRKFGPRLFLGFITVTWGITIMCFGFVNSWGPMVGLRLILGALEGGFFPAVLYLISTWYTRFELQQRFSVFYLIGCVASALGGILAYGLMQMDGVAGYDGWRWIFIMEGIATVLIGVGGYVVLVDFPDHEAEKKRFLSDREMAFILRRINQDRDDAELEPFNLRKWAAAGLDVKLWAFGLIFFCNGTIAYAILFFLPIILRTNMHFSIAASQCLVAPPYILAAILMYTSSVAADKRRIRGPIVAMNNLISLVGVPILGFTNHAGVKYFGVFLVAAGATANFPAVMAYQSNNIRGQWKRAFASASLVGVGSIGGIAGSLVFRSQDAPTYYPGLWAIIACNLLVLVLVAILTFYFRSCNRKADQGKMVIEGLDTFRFTI